MFAVYPLVAAAALAPLVGHATTHVAVGDGSGDSFLFLWNIWWVKVAVFERLASPFHTDLIYWPQGTQLALHSMSLANGFLSAPIQLAFPGTAGLVFALNLMVVLTFVLTGIAAHRLAEASGARPLAAVLSGLLAMLAPYRFFHLSHLDVLSMQWGLLCLLWLPRALESGAAAWRARIVLAVLAALTTYSDYEVAVYTAMASVFLVIWRWSSAPSAASALRIVRGIAISLGMTLVLHIPLLLALLGINDRVRPAGGRLYVATLGTLVRHGASGPPNEAFLGTAFVIVLVVMAVFVRRPAFWMWLLLGGGFLVLSLGDALEVGHTTLLEDQMPWVWLKAVAPFMNLSRTPVRMAGFGSVLLAVAMGTAFQKTTAGSRKRDWVVAGLMVLLVAERWPWSPIATIEATVPQAYQSLAAEPGDFVIRPLPDRYRHQLVYMFWQTVHRKRITGGYVSRPTDAVRASIEEWQSLSGDQLRARLNAAGVRYVIVHTDDASKLLTTEPRVSMVTDSSPSRSVGGSALRGGR